MPDQGGAIQSREARRAQIETLLTHAKPHSLSAGKAEDLIDDGFGDLVARHADRFSGLDESEIAMQLIDAGLDYLVLRYMGEHEPLGAFVAQALMDRHTSGSYVVNNFGRFKDLDPLYLAERLLASGQGWAVALHMDSVFREIDSTEMAQRLINAGEGLAVAFNAPKFHGSNPRDLERRLVEHGDGRLVSDYAERFDQLAYQRPQQPDEAEPEEGDA